MRGFIKSRVCGNAEISPICCPVQSYMIQMGQMVFGRGCSQICLGKRIENADGDKRNGLLISPCERSGCLYAQLFL